MSRTTFTSLLLCLGCCVAPIALAQDASAQDASAQDQTNREQLSRGVEATLLELGARDALGDSGEPLTVSKPAQVHYELGAVVDVRSTDNGLEVLAITPGGAAERLALKRGDRLLAINGASLTGIANAGAVLDKAMRDSNGQLRLRIARGERTMELSGAADVAATPAYVLTVGANPAVEGCGYVTAVLGVPPESRQVFDALITQIDGRSTPLSGEPNRFRVSAGRHVLTVNEHIERSRLSLGQQHRISLLRRHERGKGELSKVLVVEVEPGTSYRVGAHLRKERLDADSIRANQYWEPVVYDTASASCD